MQLSRGFLFGIDKKVKTTCCKKVNPFIQKFGIIQKRYIIHKSILYNLRVFTSDDVERCQAIIYYLDIQRTLNVVSFLDVKSKKYF